MATRIPSIQDWIIDSDTPVLGNGVRKHEQGGAGRVMNTARG